MARAPRDPEKTSKPKPGFEQKLAEDKRASTLQILFKVARLLDELALERVAARQRGPRLRRSHTSLFPHIALEGTRITELSERLGITKQAVSQLVDDLEGLGVLARVPDAEDGRARRVVFTKLGRDGLLKGLAVLRELEQELSDAVGSTKMASMRGALLAIHDLLEARVQEGAEKAEEM